MSFGFIMSSDFLEKNGDENSNCRKISFYHLFGYSAAHRKTAHLDLVVNFPLLPFFSSTFLSTFHLNFKDAGYSFESLKIDEKT
jgi:hypothetical protein